MSKNDPGEPIPSLFATIHHRGPDRPDGYTAEEISWLNVEANRHIPDLHAKLLATHREAFPKADEAQR